MRKLPVILFAALCIAGCSPEPVNAPEDQLVVEGWIEDGEAPVVYLTTSLAISREPANLSSLKEHIVKWAKVTVSDGEEEVVLTGMASSRFYPPYAYTTGRMFGQAGKTYTITVDYGEVHATGQATIPPKRALDNLVAVPQNDAGDCLLNATFTPQADECYGLFVKIEKADSTFLPAPLSFFESAVLGPSATVAIRPGGSVVRSDSRVFFRSGETVDVKFRTMEKPIYSYWKAFGEQYGLARVPVFSLDSNLPGNIDGALGYFAGYGSTVYSLTIP